MGSAAVLGCEWWRRPAARLRRRTGTVLELAAEDGRATRHGDKPELHPRPTGPVDTLATDKKITRGTQCTESKARQKRVQKGNVLYGRPLRKRDGAMKQRIRPAVWL